MEILYDASKAWFTKPPHPMVDEKLYDLLKYEVKGANKSELGREWIWRDGKKVRNPRYGKWDFQKRLYNKKDHTFPAGLTGKVQKHFPGIIIKSALKPIAPVAHGLKGLRWYQEGSIEHMLENLRAIVDIPTGGGKTFIAAAMALALKNGIGLITVPSQYLLYQTYNELLPIIGEQNLGIYGDGVCDIKKVTVATIQSLSTNFDPKRVKPEVIAWLQAIDWWVCDETHGAAAESYETLGSYMPRCLRRYGVSATPQREDNKDLVMEGVIGPVVFRVPPMRLVEEGYLARPNFEWHFWKPEGLIYEVKEGKKKPTYDTVYDACFVNDPAYHDYVHQQVMRAVADGMGPVVVIVDKIEHGKNLLATSPLESTFISGKHSQKQREKAISELVSGERQVLYASGILDTGVNIPEMMTLLCAGGGRSKVESMQRWGRPLRIDPAKRKKVLGCRIVEMHMCEPLFLQDHAARRRMEAKERYPGCNVDFY